MAGELRSGMGIIVENKACLLVNADSNAMEREVSVVNCNEKTAPMEISKTQALHAHHSNVVQLVLKVLEVVLYVGGSEWFVMCAVGAGCHALYAVLYSGGCGGLGLFAGGAGSCACAVGAVMCCVLLCAGTCPQKGCDVCWRLWKVGFVCWRYWK
jgi:hypothetical protein